MAAAKVSSPGGFACVQCGARFNSLQALGGHKSVHNGKKKRSRDSSSRADEAAALNPKGTGSLAEGLSALDKTPSSPNIHEASSDAKASAFSFLQQQHHQLLHRSASSAGRQPSWVEAFYQSHPSFQDAQQQQQQQQELRARQEAARSHSDLKSGTTLEDSAQRCAREAVEASMRAGPVGNSFGSSHGPTHGMFAASSAHAALPGAQLGASKDLGSAFCAYNLDTTNKMLYSPSALSTSEAALLSGLGHPGLAALPLSQWPQLGATLAPSGTNSPIGSHPFAAYLNNLSLRGTQVPPAAWQYVASAAEPASAAALNSALLNTAGGFPSSSMAAASVPMPSAFSALPAPRVSSFLLAYGRPSSTASPFKSLSPRASPGESPGPSAPVRMATASPLHPLSLNAPSFPPSASPALAKSGDVNALVDLMLGSKRHRIEKGSFLPRASCETDRPSLTGSEVLASKKITSSRCLLALPDRALGAAKAALNAEDVGETSGTPLVRPAKAESSSTLQDASRALLLKEDAAEQGLEGAEKLHDMASSEQQTPLLRLKQRVVPDAYRRYDRIQDLNLASDAEDEGAEASGLSRPQPKKSRSNISSHNRMRPLAPLDLAEGQSSSPPSPASKASDLCAPAPPPSSLNGFQGASLLHHGPSAAAAPLPACAVLMRPPLDLTLRLALPC